MHFPGRSRVLRNDIEYPFTRVVKFEFYPAECLIRKTAHNGPEILFFGRGRIRYAAAYFHHRLMQVARGDTVDIGSCGDDPVAHLVESILSRSDEPEVNKQPYGFFYLTSRDFGNDCLDKSPVVIVEFMGMDVFADGEVIPAGKIVELVSAYLLYFRTMGESGQQHKVILLFL